MPALLAPYHNAMRLGQGFNSYTQQICLDSAVKVAENGPASKEDAANSFDRKSQIVSYSSRFVDKLSDVTDAMNISASLSIKTSTVGGKASGSYIDSDKFKESDLNFFIQVKVTNQTQVAKDLTEFQKIDSVTQSKFAEIYGDTFISGFEEGGELNALISVKVADKSKTFAIKAELEGSLGTPALSGEVKGKVDIEKSSGNSSTETTVTVNWSGGGQIKEQNVLWDINSLTLAAANFPDMVARTPQRTYAMLTKYTALTSFHKQMGGFSVMDYENAGIYTSALLDSYMEYKSIWKQIQVASFELQNQRADMKTAVIPNDIASLEPPKTVPPKPSPGDTPKSESSSNLQIIDSKKRTTSRQFNYVAYPATTVGLQKARLDCRMEMIKIVNEVDHVTLDPELALDPERDSMFVSPVIFKQILPVVTLRPVDPATEGKGYVFPSKQVILGVSDEDREHSLFENAKDGTPLYQSQVVYAERHKSKWRQFSMGSAWVGAWTPINTDQAFNDLEVLDASYLPVAFTIWHNSTGIVGLQTEYTDNREIRHGTCTGNYWKIDLTTTEATRVIKILSGNSVIDDKYIVDSICMIDDVFNSRQFKAAQRQVAGDWILKSPQEGPWSVRGFWGTFGLDGTGCSSLGIVWGRDSLDAIAKQKKAAIERVGKRSGQHDFYIGKTLPKKLQDSMDKCNQKREHFYITEVVGCNGADDESPNLFNALETIDETWKPNKVEVWYNTKATQCVLTGLRVTYTNEKSLMMGLEDGAVMFMSFDATFQSSSGWPQGITGIYLTAAEHDEWKKKTLTSCRLITNRINYLNVCEGNRSTKNETRLLHDQKSPGWTFRGFYGQWGGAIDSLGLIWGKD